MTDNLQQDRIHVRQVQVEDVELVRRLRLSGLRQAPLAFGARYEDELNLDDDAWRNRVRANAVGEASVAFLAFDQQGGEGVGLVVGVFDEADSADLVSMWVEPTARGLGVGRGLAEKVIDWARARGARQLSLQVAPDNESARALYHKIGFRSAGAAGRCGIHETSERMTFPL